MPAVEFKATRAHDGRSCAGLLGAAFAAAVAGQALLSYAGSGRGLREDATEAFNAAVRLEAPSGGRGGQRCNWNCARHVKITRWRASRKRSTISSVVDTARGRCSDSA